jgi:hypothetical protein
MVRRYKLLFCVLAGLCLPAGALFAQVKSSAITGTVMDASGARVPRASVTVLDEATNVSVEAETSDTGDYMVPYLPAGRYTLAVKATGFQTYRKTGIAMDSATIVRADVQLVTGSLATSVEVSADALALQTENSAVQSSVNQQLIANLPNINNNPLYYATLQAGVVATPQMYNSRALGVGYADRQAMSATRINGGALGTNDVQLDGVSVQGAAWHETAVLPDRDSLQEVRVVTNSFSADTGNAQGLISMITKSGTNSFHGGLKYRLRNEALNANGLYNNTYNIRRSKYRVNEYGGNVGGPVILPKLFNGKDKLFFFASYSRLTNKQPDNALATVPTEKERQGDFSSTMVRDNNGNPAPVNIFDPYSSKPYQGSSTIVERSPYPNNIITNPDPYGLKIAQAYPLPNQAPTDAFGHNNYSFSGTIPIVRNSLATRVDYRPTDKHSVYFSAGKSFGSFTPPNRWGDDNAFVNIAMPGVTSDSNPYGAVGDTITLNPTTVLDVRYGVTRIHTASTVPVGTGFNYAEYGMPANVQSLVALSGTAPSIGGFNAWTELNNDSWARKAENQLNHVITGSVTKVRGRWTLKAGGEYRVYLGNWQDLQYATPAIGVWQQGTIATGRYGDIYGNNSSLITNPVDSGAAGAIIMTGATGWYLGTGTTTKPALVAKYGALYTQNDWRVNSKLTINLGLRYEVQPGPTERYNRMSAYSLKDMNAFAAGLDSLPNANALAYYGAVVFPGQNGLDRNLWTTSWDNISPRIGAAYRLSDSTVLRGGYGRIYVPSNTGFNANGTFYGTGPYSSGASSIPYGLTPTTGVPIGRFEDPQNTMIIPATGNVPDPANYCCNGGWVLANNYKNGRTDQWNFFVEHNLGHNWMISAGYVGSHGTNLNWYGYPISGTWSIPESTLSSWRSSWLASNGLNDPASVQIPNPLPALIGYSGGTTISTSRAQLPYLALTGATYLASEGSSNYNALQIRAQRALTNGLQLMFNYTWSKNTGISGGSGNSTFAETQLGNSVNAVGGTDYRNLNNNSGLLGFDTPHRFVGVVSYLLPTGKGKALDPGNTVVRAIVGDWQLASAITLQSGMPWGPSCGTMNGRCNRVAGEPVEVPEELQGWYDGKTTVTLPNGRRITPTANTYLKWNPDLFSVPVVQLPNGTYQADQYQWGSSAKYYGWLRTPGLYNVNLTVNRMFQVHERVQMELVGEATNLLNATQFASRSVRAYVGSVLQDNPSTNTKVGQNSDVTFGSLDMNFMEPRQVTLSLRLRF